MDYSLIVGVVRRKFEVRDTGTAADSDSSVTLTNLGRDVDGGLHAAVVEGPGTSSPSSSSRLSLPPLSSG